MSILAELHRPDTVQTLKKMVTGRNRMFYSKLEMDTFKILRVRVHLAGQSLHQLRDKLLHESLALLGDEANWDEVARAVEHLPQLLLMDQGWK